MRENIYPTWSLGSRDGVAHRNPTTRPRDGPKPVMAAMTRERQRRDTRQPGATPRVGPSTTDPSPERAEQNMVQGAVPNGAPPRPGSCLGRTHWSHPKRWFSGRSEGFPAQTILHIGCRSRRLNPSRSTHPVHALHVLPLPPMKPEASELVAGGRGAQRRHHRRPTRE